ncbi:uncharacterized protein [Zea mays]|uniref:Transcription factor MYBS3 n=1 Tax=Zea mays TaxID=4577 RepID=A0A804QVI4_MAIZE|nr:uncharacterized protein LOC100194332 isoform X2 [Zea mays]|eukprot:XP_008654445.1 putative MYB DNA-binding domain superfamily protein isoform X2 [Zea mays]
MARKCSHCGNYGHNSRTCGLGLGLGHREIMLCEGGDDNNGRSGLRLFGVQVRIGGGGGAGSASMKKSYSMDCLQLAAPHACSSLVSSPSSSSLCSSSSPSSLLLSIDDGLQRGAADGYLSDGPHGRAVQERKKADVSKQKQYSGYIPTTPGVPWSEEEHRQFLAGLDKLGKGDWRGIARSYVPTRTPTQVASHAQKFFLRQSSMGKKKRRSSLFDMVPICENSASISDPLDVARHGVASADSERAAVDVDLMNSTTEGDDGRSRDVVSSASGAGTALRFPAAAAQTEPLHPSSSHGHGRGHHCSPLDLELGMSLPAPSVGT